ncbi:glycosyltransferase involved in cell wall biosynthesis [Chitinophaga dinghuensis]|uniref:Glycosyltransferase involved in cell wall biosynthesis n=1 Tax=Chitinophaga dinghuensis TaxID=1539050 RepID=A0A327VKU9_9BACT|nr:glycosyltransferase family 2 protein [Chitinophaga dinghuensis]RAJ73480.1 glycosyltransferase involved in cell wall biosynthesis [Chitinophaga dinghuensis]
MTNKRFSPVISIITVCYNAEQYIAHTIESVLSQTYPHIEHIIVDGASKDKTMEVVARYGARLAKVISEKDKGLYDAMNKGLQLATGDYVYFLNADDVFLDTQVLEKMMASCENADVYYGEAMFLDAAGKALGLRSELTPQKVPENLDWKSLQHGMVVSHQAFIVKRDICPPYDLRYKVSADIDWMIKVLKQTKVACNTHLVVAGFRVGGTSKQRQRLAWKERYQILSHHYGKVSNFLHHLYIAGRYIVSKKY